jgi:hypothetical protein
MVNLRFLHPSHSFFKGCISNFSSYFLPIGVFLPPQNGPNFLNSKIPEFFEKPPLSEAEKHP